LAEGGTTTGPFSHGRDLSSAGAGTLIYFGGYATNGGGTAYSSDGQFYLEPYAASGVTFSDATSTSMTVTWAAGTGADGYLVLMKAGFPVNQAPTDGTDSYYANSIFSIGTELLDGSYVVFKGVGTSVLVTGLSPGIYYVRVYAYAGSGPLINYQQDAPAIGSQAIFAPPTGITLSDMRTKGPLVSWNTVSGADLYNIYRSPDGSNWTLIGSVSHPTNSFGDSTAPKSNTLYYWTVTSQNADGESSQPAGASGRTALLKGWNMVSVPYNTTGKSPTEVYGSWAWWAWTWVSTGNTDPDNNGYYEQASEVVPGRSLFIWSFDDRTVLSYSGIDNPSDEIITLNPGWTLISNQTPSPMTGIGTTWMLEGTTPLTDAIVSNIIGGAIYWWNGSTHDSENISDDPPVESWKGYWILNMESVEHTLTIQ
jgi:hypothetical protein